MRKVILALSLCALVPMVSIAVARADNDDALVEEEYETDEINEESLNDETGNDVDENDNATDDNDIADVANDNDDGADDTDVAPDSGDADGRGVAKRMNCADIKKEMDRLSALTEPADADIEQLYRVKSDYRAKCMQKAAGRGRGLAKPKPINSGAVAAVETGGVSWCDTPDANGCCPGEKYTNMGSQGFNCCTDDGTRCFPPMANKNAAKKTVDTCDDGGQPDKNGCCAGEKYTDLGKQGFNCCKSDGLTCFPPIKIKK